MKATPKALRRSPICCAKEALPGAWLSQFPGCPEDFIALAPREIIHGTHTLVHGEPA